nr:hypothetical protein [Tanacetum cinerariifolium]
GDSDEEDDDEDEFEDDANNDDGSSDDHDDDSDDEKTESNRDEIPDLKLTNVDQTEHEEEDKILIKKKKMKLPKELYDDVNVNLGNKDTKMTNADQGASKQQNAYQQSGSEKEEKDAHVTLTPVHDTQKTGDFASVFKFNENVTNLEKDLSEIKQVDQYAQALSFIPTIVDCYMDNKLREAINKAIQAHNFDCREEAQAKKKEYIELIDSMVRTIIKEEVNTQQPRILPQAISDVATPVIDKNVIESLQVVVLRRSSAQPQSPYEATATLFEFELIKILIDKMDKNKSFNVADYKRELYDALVKSYNTDKNIFESYGEVFSLKRSQDDKDKDQDPSTRSDRGTKRRKSSKDEPPTSFDKLNDTSFDFSAFVMNRLKIPNLTQEILVGPAFNLLKGTCKSITKLEYHFEECSKATTERLDWHNPKNKLYQFDLRKPLPLFQDHRGHQIIPKDYFINNDLEYLKGGDLSRRYSTSVTKSKAATYELKWIEDLVLELWSPVQMYDYGHLEEIQVHRDDYKLYTFRVGDFKRLCLQDIEDLLLLLVQQNLTNLTIDERLDLNVALRMYTRRIVIQRRVEDLQLDTYRIIYVDQYRRKKLLRADELHKFNDGMLNDVRSALVIQRRVEDLQLGVENYQKKLNLTKPNTYRSNLKNKTAYTSYSDTYGIIYVDQYRRKKLLRADELHKFNDGMLNDVRSALHDIDVGIRMEYLPMRKWSNLDKKMARVMVQDIEKQLYQRRLMRNLEKFVDGTEYENDRRLLERTI